MSTATTPPSPAQAQHSLIRTTAFRTAIREENASRSTSFAASGPFQFHNRVDLDFARDFEERQR